ncbi:MAG: Signal recognition particle 54 kDa protein [Promethearchaeota archaeon]|jgi:fused signal recognition particle receptor|nr:MAG: Signal recognition particle 54 kDa protein [Candidatus Lokiarchaeota archaeon]
MLDKLKNAFSTFVNKTLTEEKLEDTIKDLNILLISNDVAMETADAICESIIDSFRGEEVGRLTSTSKLLEETLEEVITDILTPDQEINLLEQIEQKRITGGPYVIVFLGVNGTGKTTTMAKVAHFLKKEGYSVVAAASDTFRAGAIEQLSHHMDNVGVRVIKNQYKSDPASVAYDAVDHATAKQIDVVLVDTAGRQVTDKNLMREIEKICRIARPDLKIFVGDSLAGNDALFQAQEFNKYVGIDATILTKLDADAKGGAALSVSHETKKPIIFVGTGQKYEDLEPFDPDLFITNILEE